MAQPYPGKYGRQMELPVTGCGIGASVSVGELDTSFEKVPEGRMANDYFLSPTLQKVDGDIESPFDIIHETDIFLEEKIRKPCSRWVRASPGLDPRRRAAGIPPLLHCRIGAECDQKGCEFGGELHLAHGVCFGIKVDGDLRRTGQLHHVATRGADLWHIGVHDVIALLGHQGDLVRGRKRMKAEG